jgi:tetratricopeptide (TPR) repeat protein
LNERPSPDPRLDELGRKIATDPAVAVHELRLLIGKEPLNVDAYRLLAAAIAEEDRRSPAAGTVRTVIGGMDQAQMRASGALASRDLETAEVILRQRLVQRPTDAFALVLMARLARVLAFPRQADELLQLAVEFKPDFILARIEIAIELQRQNRHSEAIEEADAILQLDPANEVALTLKGDSLGRAGRYVESVALYEQLLERSPREAGLWTSYGHVLKTMGRFDEGHRAMRTAVEIAPSSGEAWWNLSNLKVAQFSEEDLRTMEGALEDPDLSVENCLQLHFALGKAMEDRREYEAAFRHYDEGNRLRRRSLDYDPEDVTNEVTALRRRFTDAFFAERSGFGSPASDVIFVLGMHRSGSTLVEQILASHSSIEGTMELSDASMIARDAGRGEPDFLDRLSTLGREKFSEMGDEYMRRTRPHRIQNRPLFIDKMPNNWLLVPFIHLILPNAKIIDARRHPMACGFSNYKQHYALGQAFTYDLEWFGRYYSDYVRLMDHVDRVLPGRVYRLIHEELVLNPEREIRNLLDYVGVPFEESCLRFHENSRAVRTPSSEQVRQPLNPAALGHWRAFEPWLEPLRSALGPVAELYPDAPDFAD